MAESREQPAECRQEGRLLYSALLSSALLCSALLSSALLSPLLYSTLLYSALLCPPLLGPAPRVLGALQPLSAHPHQEGRERNESREASLQA